MPATHFSTGQFSYFGLWFTRQSKSLFLIQGSATSPDPVSDFVKFPDPAHLQKNCERLCLCAATAKEELPLEIKSLPFPLRTSESSVTLEYFCYTAYVKPSAATWLFSS